MQLGFHVKDDGEKNSPGESSRSGWKQRGYQQAAKGREVKKLERDGRGTNLAISTKLEVVGDDRVREPSQDVLVDLAGLDLTEVPNRRRAVSGGVLYGWWRKRRTRR